MNVREQVEVVERNKDGTLTSPAVLIEEKVEKLVRVKRTWYCSCGRDFMLLFTIVSASVLLHPARFEQLNQKSLNQFSINLKNFAIFFNLG